jgi:hypothetical protein
MIRLAFILLLALPTVVLAADCLPAPASSLPTFHHKGVVLDYKGLKYNPCDDVIIPSVVRTDHFQRPLGRYYLVLSKPVANSTAMSLLSSPPQSTLISLDNPRPCSSPPGERLPSSQATCRGPV